MCERTNQKDKKPPSSCLLADQEAPAHVNTVFGNVPLGCILSCQLNDLKEGAVVFSCDRPLEQVRAKADELKNILSFPKLPKTRCSAPPQQNIPDDHTIFIAKITLDLETARQIEQTTVKQSSDPQWFLHRKFRLTASYFGLVVNRKKRPTDAFLRNIFQPRDLSNVASIKHGKQNDITARTLYANEMQRKNQKFTVYEAGLIVNPSLPFLGASPDGKVFDPTERDPFGLLEIKAPYTWRNCTFLEACQDENSICHIVDGTPQLKINHKSGYYSQVQGQLALSGLTCCDFVVFLTGSRNIHVQRIYSDAAYWMHTILPKLLSFHFEHALPYFYSQECVAVSSCSDMETEEEICYSHTYN